MSYRNRESSPIQLDSGTYQATYENSGPHITRTDCFSVAAVVARSLSNFADNGGVLSLEKAMHVNKGKSGSPQSVPGVKLAPFNCTHNN